MEFTISFLTGLHFNVHTQVIGGSASQRDALYTAPRRHPLLLAKNPTLRKNKAEQNRVEGNTQ